MEDLGPTLNTPSCSSIKILYHKLHVVCVCVCVYREGP